MRKITTLSVLVVWLACGGGQKPDRGGDSTGPTEYAPLPDEKAPAAQPTVEQTPPASSDEEALAQYNKDKKAPNDAQKKLLAEAEADLSSMVDRICSCPDKKCLEALQTEFQTFGVKYRDLEDIQIPQDTLNRMMQLGQRVAECTKSLVNTGNVAD